MDSEIKNTIIKGVRARVSTAEFIVGESLLVECSACPGSRFDPWDLPAPERGVPVADAMFGYLDEWIEKHKECSRD